MKEKRISRMACIMTAVILCSVCGCGKEKLPEYPPDMISTAYHEMSGQETFRTHGILTLDMKISEVDKQYTVETTAVSLEDPREITVQLIRKENGEEEGTYYLYYNEDLREDEAYLFDGTYWTSETLEKMVPYEDPVPFSVYFTDIHSFKELAEEGGVSILQGTVDGENTVFALKESGVLKRFALTSLEEELAEKLDKIKVKAWVDQKTGNIKKAEADMTDTVKKLATLFYEENGVAGPEISSCRYEIDSIHLDNAVRLPLPAEAEKALREALTKE